MNAYEINRLFSSIAKESVRVCHGKNKGKKNAKSAIATFKSKEGYLEFKRVCSLASCPLSVKEIMSKAQRQLYNQDTDVKKVVILFPNYVKSGKVSSRKRVREIRATLNRVFGKVEKICDQRATGGILQKCLIVHFEKAAMKRACMGDVGHLGFLFQEPIEIHDYSNFMRKGLAEKALTQALPYIIREQTPTNQLQNLRKLKGERNPDSYIFRSDENREESLWSRPGARTSLKMNKPTKQNFSEQIPPIYNSTNQERPDRGHEQGTQLLQGKKSAVKAQEVIRDLSSFHVDDPLYIRIQRTTSSLQGPAARESCPRERTRAYPLEFEKNHTPKIDPPRFPFQRVQFQEASLEFKSSLWNSSYSQIY
jgi:hypothetical protein